MIAVALRAADTDPSRRVARSPAVSRALAPLARLGALFAEDTTARRAAPRARSARAPRRRCSTTRSAPGVILADDDADAAAARARAARARAARRARARGAEAARPDAPSSRTLSRARTGSSASATTRARHAS